MVVADGHGLPMGWQVASAQPHARRLAESTLATVKVPQRRGRPRTRPKALVADRAYDSRAFRQQLRRRGSKPTIPACGRRRTQQPKRGRPIRTGLRDRQRWKIERCCGWMDHCRRLVVRYERAVEHDKTCCSIASILGCVNLILKKLVVCFYGLLE